MAKEVPQLVKAALRAVLLSQKGIKQTDLPRDYKKLNDSQLDVKKYGFQDLYEFLLAIPDVARLEYSPKDGENKVFGVAEKGIFISDHAKKNMGVPNGLKPLHPSQWPRNVNKNERTSATTESDSKRKIVRNSSGLYAIHVKNLPPNCQQSDIKSIFKSFKSLVQVNISGSRNRVAFVQFSNYGDADKALRDMDGFNFQGFSLIINPAIGRNDKASKDAKVQCKQDSAKKKANSAAAKSIEDKSPPKNELQTVHIASSEDWETVGGLLSPKSDAAGGNKFFRVENLAGCIRKMDVGYPIHVSNFPPGTAQSTLKQIFSGCGEVIRVEVHEKHAFIHFAKEEEAVTALQAMRKKVYFGNKLLTVTPRTSKGKATRQLNLPGGAPALSRGSSQSSVSSCDPQSPVNCSISEAGFDLGNSDHGLTPTGISCDVVKSVANKNKTTDGSGVRVKQRTYNSVIDVTNDSCLNEEKERQCTEAFDEKTCSSTTSESSKQGVPVHTLLSYKEMCELMQRCRKPMKNPNSIVLDEFDVLVTEVIDSCHFWANVDDQSGSYKELQQIKTDLQIVEHRRRCTPVKYQLGAARYSEDDKWYRCWCLEVSSVARKEVKVFYIDYGNCEWISWDHFTVIHKRFWDLAPQAMPFKLAGLELSSNLEPNIANEGYIYLRNLICDKVCRARKLKQQESNQEHVTEVELTLKEGKIAVNDQMAHTRYVNGGTVKPNLKQPVQESNPLSSHQTTVTRPTQKSESHHIPPHPFMRVAAQKTHQSTQMPQSDALGTQAAAQMANTTTPLTAQSEGHDLLPRKESSALSDQAAQMSKSPFPSPQGSREKCEQQRQQQLLPNQLFEKLEIMRVFLSSIESHDDIYFFLADKETNFSLMRIQYLLKHRVNPSSAGKIYPKEGDVVVKLSEKGTRFRVKIVSIPRSSTYGIDKVVVKDIDYGKTETVSLSALSELPPSLKDIPGHAIQAKLAGLKRKERTRNSNDTIGIVNYLVKSKQNREVMEASVIKRDLDGIHHVELFESGSISSVNVQLVKLGHADLDPSQCSLSASYVTTPKSGVFKSPEKLETSDSPVTGLTDRLKDVHHCETRSVHSDWEDSLIEVEDEWGDITPLTRTHMETPPSDQLYLPPPPGTPLPSPPVATSSASGTLTVEPPSSPTGFSKNMHSVIGPLLLGVKSRNEPSDSCNLYSESNVNSEGFDVHACYTGEIENRASNEVRPPSPATGSDSSGVYSDTSVNCLSGAETVQSKEEKSLLGSVIPQQTEEANSAGQDWRREREELIQRDSELRRILEMPRQEMKKMIDLRQEKERLERKIRVKQLENEILKLQRELKRLEFDKEELEKGIDQ